MGWFNTSNYQPCGKLHTTNTASITFSGDGSTCIPLSGFTNISSIAGNTLRILSDGLYVSGGSLTTDTYVTGGTYSNGSTTFTNNTGGTFSVTGYYTGGTLPTDVFVTGGTYSNGTASFTNTTGGTFSVTGFASGIIVTAKTTNYNISSQDTGKYFTNQGATGTTNYTLPSAATNLIYTFIVQSNHELDVTANSGNTIRSGANVTATAGSISSVDVGSVITLVAINSTEWMATYYNGTWII